MVIRTCIGCRAREQKSALVRLVAQTSDSGTLGVVVDVTGSSPGRGAHVHPDPQCLELAIQRRAIGRALRLEGPFELSDHTGIFGSPR